MKGLQGRYWIVSKRPALGKGMGALISAEVPEQEDDDKKSVIEVSIDKISGNPGQPRKTFDDDGLEELSNSIREKGVIQPILVEKSGGSYIIIAGERRYRASRLAGLKTVPVIVGDFSENEKLEIALIENIQRENLNPIEEALAYHDLMDRANLSQEEVALKVGKNRSTVANSLRLLKLPDEIRQSLVEQRISAGHARAILSLDTETRMNELHRKILTEGLSVRDAESFSGGAKKSGGKKAKAAAKKSANLHPELSRIQDMFIDKLGTKVNISGTLSKGKIEIAYFSMDDLERIYEILK